MTSSPKWLSILQRVREHRRDAALHSLAQSLQAATKIREAISGVEETISSLSHAQQQCAHAGRLDAERLLQIRQDRDNLRSQLTDLIRRRGAAEVAVVQIQAIAAEKDAEVDVLRRLSDRYDSADRQARRRQDEQSLTEFAASLCNGTLYD